MRTTRRLMVGLAVAALVSGTLASCGDDDDTDPGLANPTTDTTESIPTDTAPVPTETVTLYFSRDGGECDEVEPVTRTVEGGVTIELVVRELLAGPDESERAAGFGSWLSAATAEMLEWVEVDDGVALISFDPELRQVISGASAACASANLLAQLDATIAAVDGVDRAHYALGGDVDAFYEWLQRDPPAR